MANFDLAIPRTLAREGGARYTEDPNDRGGATKYGISQRAYPNLDIKNLTEAQAREIYKRDYWDRVRGDDILSQAIAEQILDTAVNMGIKTASRLAQTVLGIEPADGVIGSESLKIINQADDQKFVAEYTLAKIARYAAICNRDRSQTRFLLGWLNRALGGMS